MQSPFDDTYPNSWEVLCPCDFNLHFPEEFHIHTADVFVLFWEMSICLDPFSILNWIICLIGIEVLKGTIYADFVIFEEYGFPLRSR